MNLNELKKLCVDKHIPIVRDKTLNLIKDIISKNNYSSILEIGSAYGYSALALSQLNCIKKIISIEKNKENYLIAMQSKTPKIQFINVDAFNYVSKNKFDFIFIDGPKSHQEKLFDKYFKYLNTNGTIVIDNIFLKKFDNQSTLTKNQKRLVEKVKNFRKWLETKKDIKLDILDIDDGIAIVKSII